MSKCGNINRAPLVIAIADAFRKCGNMRIYAGSNPTGVDHGEDLTLASSCSLSNIK